MVKRTDPDKNIKIRVYQYGLVPIGQFPEQGIEELCRSKKLWNRLVEIHNKNFDQFKEARCQEDPQYRKISEQLDKLNEKIDDAYKKKRKARNQANTRDPNHPLLKTANEKIKQLKATRKELWQSEKNARKNADKLINKSELNNAFKEKIKAAQRVKNSDNLNPQTANRVADRFRTAREQSFKKGAKLRYHGFDGTGGLFYRFRRPNSTKDGITFDELYADINKSGKQRRFIILNQSLKHDKKPRYRLRIKVAGSAKKASKIYAEFDLILHRPLPANSQIQNAELMRARVGDAFQYNVCFTVRQEQVELAQIKKKRPLGIDIGFRELDGKIRIAYIYDDEEKRFDEISLPYEYKYKLKYIDELKGKLDNSASKLGTYIKPLLKQKPPTEDQLPEAKYRLISKIIKSPVDVTLSFEQAYKLGGYFAKHQRGVLAKPVEAALIEWWRKHGLSYREIHRLRRKLLRQKQDYYRNKAIELVRRGQPIGIEEIDWSRLAETRDTDNLLSNTARSNRFLSAPSLFLNAIKNAGERCGLPVEKVAAKNTSKTCHACGKVNKELEAELNWQCLKCGKQHDRDENAAINIAKKTFEKLNAKNYYDE